MGKVLFGGGVAEIRRSIAGQTFSRNKGGAYIRNRVRPTNPQTVFQINQRNRLTQLSKRWGQNLNELQREAWISFADEFPITDVLGQVLILTGEQAYIKLNNRLLAAGEVVNDEAPANQDVDPVTSVTIVASVAAATILIEFAPDPVPTDHLLQVRMTPGISPGITFVKDKLRLIATSGAAQISPFDVTTAWTTRFGTFPVEGVKLVALVRFIKVTNAAISQEIRANTIVEA